MSQNEKYLNTLKKLALGYEYEEVQTMIEETEKGTKKKIIRTKKQNPPDYNALMYLINQNKKSEKGVSRIEQEMREFEERLSSGNTENQNI